MKQYSIYGAGGHARVIWDIIVASGGMVANIVDAPLAAKGGSLYHIKAVEEPRADMPPFVVAIGNNHDREYKTGLLKEIGCRFASALVHPSAVISPSAVLGEGTVVMPNAVINADARIEDHCIINTACTVDHDCMVSSFCHIAPGTHLCGNVSIGRGTLIGAGSSIIPGVSVGRHCIIGAMAAVVRDIPDYVTAVGVPALPLNT